MSLRKTLTKSRMFGFMAVLICIGFVLIFLAACNEEPIDTVWDGNYIYSGLYKCKTNGEDEEVLVNELSVDGKTYTFDYVRDYVYIGELMFLDVTFIDDEENRQVFFMKYSIQDGTHEVLCYETEFEGETYELTWIGLLTVEQGKLYYPASFENGENSLSILMSYDPQTNSLRAYYTRKDEGLYGGGGLYFTYDYGDYFVFESGDEYYSCNKITGETFLIDEEVKTNTAFSNGYLLKKDGGEVIIRSVTDGSEKKILSVPTDESVYFDNRTIENGKIYIVSWKSRKYQDRYGYIKEYTLMSSIYLYDIETEKLYNLTPRNPSETKVYSFINEKLFLEEDVYEAEKRVKDDSGNYVTEKYLARKNAKIYSFDENGNTEYLTNLFPNKEKEYFSLKEDGNIHWDYSVTWKTEKVFNPETRKIKKVKIPKTTDEERFTTYGVKCGDLYYIVDKRGWLSAPAIYRFNMKTKKVVRVQSRNRTPGTHALGSEEIDFVLPY